jgi:TPR repeat protein
MRIERLRRRAEAGSVVAQGMLGMHYLYGVDVPVDFAEAFRLLSMAAAAGAPRAAFGLAEMHRRGLGVPVDVAEAARLYERAASRGEFLAQIELGRIHAGGSGMNADVSAARWYSAALEQQEIVGPCSEIDEAKAYLAAHRDL